MNIDSGVWEFLSRDVSFLGGPQSPLLSWAGSCGILLFFLWHVLKFQRETAMVRQAFRRIHPKLIALINERGRSNRDRFSHHPAKGSSTPGHQTSSSRRIDCNDLHTLDMAMQQEPVFGSLWEQYRLTLVLEHVPWFVEPHIFSTKPAAEVFNQEAVFTNRVNLTFYRQFPSLITGIGLLLTFLALFIGLGRLHAEGSEILGIQGLINGLAGKFLTSIVALVAANLFAFMEKPLVGRLMNAHRTFLGLIDQLFPRKTIEQMLEQLRAIQHEPSRDGSTSTVEFRDHFGGWETKDLSIPSANLTAAIQSLKKMQQEEQAETRRAVTELPRIMKAALHNPLNELTQAIHDLVGLLKEAQTHSARLETSFDDRPLLWKTSVNSPTASTNRGFERISAWRKWPWLSRHRRTG